MKTIRYQDCPWYIRLWRRRHYLRIPWLTWNVWRSATLWESTTSRTHWKMSLKRAWILAVGLVQADMNWVYDLSDRIIKRNTK